MLKAPGGWDRCRDVCGFAYFVWLIKQPEVAPVRAESDHFWRESKEGRWVVYE